MCVPIMVYRRRKEIPRGSGRYYEYEQSSHRVDGKVRTTHHRYVGRLTESERLSVLDAEVKRQNARDDNPFQKPSAPAFDNKHRVISERHTISESQATAAIRRAEKRKARTGHV